MSPKPILGISAFYHDSAAALVGSNGEIIAAAQEERFTREKHTNQFPHESIRFVLSAGQCTLDDLDAIVFYEKPLLRFERLMDTAHDSAPRGALAFIRDAPQWSYRALRSRSRIEDELARLDRVKKTVPLLFSEHHLSHAASAFYPSPFHDAAILCVDGVGEYATAFIGTGKGSEITVLEELHFPHSLGLFYTACTTYCGFRANEDESKFMALAAYGAKDSEPYEQLLNQVIRIKDDGSVWLNPRFFDFVSTGPFYRSEAWAEQLTLPPRAAHEPLTERHKAFAAAVQRTLERALLRLAGYARARTGMSNLVFAGGVALNCVANARLAESDVFDRIWIQPAAGDAGGALGAALAAHYMWKSVRRDTNPNDQMRGSLLGPSFTDNEIESFARDAGLCYVRHQSDSDLCDAVAAYLATGEIIGWFQGSMEWGPRALGNRSILADPRSASVRNRLNETIKHRESFQPFAPAILDMDVPIYLQEKAGSRYMLMSPTVNATAMRTFPSAIHIDGSARVQVVERAINPRFYALLSSFKQRTSVGVLLNTSFNDRNEPIVCTPRDAYNCFERMGLDRLIMGSIEFQRPTSV